MMNRGLKKLMRLTCEMDDSRTYLVFGSAESGDSSGGGDGAEIGESLVNALVIIGAIAVLTFGMALLYKYNCMKVGEGRRRVLSVVPFSLAN